MALQRPRAGLSDTDAGQPAGPIAPSREEDQLVAGRAAAPFALMFAFDEDLDLLVEQAGVALGGDALLELLKLDAAGLLLGLGHGQGRVLLHVEGARAGARRVGGDVDL